MTMRISARANTAQACSAQNAFICRFTRQNSRSSPMLPQRRSLSKDTMSACSPGSFFPVE